MTTEPARPDPRDFHNRASYELAMEDYLASIGDPNQRVEKTAMDVIRRWREDPPKDGWE